MGGLHGDEEIAARNDSHTTKSPFTGDTALPVVLTITALLGLAGVVFALKRRKK